MGGIKCFYFPQIGLAEPRKKIKILFQIVVKPFLYFSVVERTLETDVGSINGIIVKITTKPLK